MRWHKFEMTLASQQRRSIHTSKLKTTFLTNINSKRIQISSILKTKGIVMHVRA